mmetsp:Transcript_12223/g.32936  ORF Transcript_12223/g.32936 Transcript_12223/m.32936 type:complete len:172 (+) Transcript_12223:80-595(+)
MGACISRESSGTGSDLDVIGRRWSGKDERKLRPDERAGPNGDGTLGSARVMSEPSVPGSRSVSVVQRKGSEPCSSDAQSAGIDARRCSSNATQTPASLSSDDDVLQSMLRDLNESRTAHSHTCDGAARAQYAPAQGADNRVSVCALQFEQRALYSKIDFKNLIEVGLLHDD